MGEGSGQNRREELVGYLVGMNGRYDGMILLVGL